MTSIIEKTCCMIADRESVLLLNSRAVEEIHRHVIIAMLEGFDIFITDLASAAALEFAKTVQEEMPYIGAICLEAMIETNEAMSRMFRDENTKGIIGRCSSYGSWENMRGGDRRAMHRFMMDKSKRVLLPFDGRQREDSDVVYAIEYLYGLNRYDDAVILEI